VFLYNLVKNVLESFLKGKPYGYLCFCTDCNVMLRLSALVLDCGCVWTKFGKEVMSEANGIDYGKCDKQHKLNSIDFCLINDFVSFRFVYSMIFHYFTQINNQIYATDYAISHSTIENIKYFLKDTKAITHLNLKSRNIGNEGIKAIIEALKVNTTLTILNLWSR